MASSVETSVSLTTCSICFETFKVPKSLPCLHTFCEECITKYISSILAKSEAPEGSFACPICRCKIVKPNGIDTDEWAKSLPLNHLMINIMDCDSLGKGRICTSCERENETESATNWCAECRDSLCENCTKWHRRFGKTENHKIVKINELDKSCVSSISVLKCPKHPERAIEAFCSDHKVTCCLACVTIEHRKCEDVGTVETAAENLRHSNVLHSLEKDLSVIDTRLKDLANEKEGNISELKTTSISIKSEIADVRTRINSHLDKIQEETLNELSKIEQTVIPDLEMERDEIGCQQSVVSCGLSILKTGLNYASDAQMLDEIAKIKDAKVKLEGFLNKARRSPVQIQFELSWEILDIESRIGVFGRVSTCEVAPKDVPKMDPLKGSARKVLEFETSNHIIFTGGVMLQDDKFLIAHHCARTLEMYDPKGNLLSKLSFDGHPWSVEMTGDTTGVMTVYDKHLLVFFNITGGNKLVETKRVLFDKSCFDVRYHEDKLYMTCDTEIKILDTNGTSTGKIFPLSSEARFLDIDPQGRTLCYSSNNCHILTCTGMDGSESFTYKSDQLSGSTSVTRDFAGNIYIAGCSSGNIHQLDKRGQLNKIIVSGLSSPYALRFQKYSNKFITNSNGTAIVYEIV